MREPVSHRWTTSGQFSKFKKDQQLTKNTADQGFTVLLQSATCMKTGRPAPISCWRK
jgi:hypothetical protein